MALSKVKTNMIDGTISAITKVTSDPTKSTNPSDGVGSIYMNKNSGEMFCCTDATAGANVWTNVGEGTGNIFPFTGTAATGGTITTDGDYKVHTFTTSGTFTVTEAGTNAEVEYLVIAGGGGGCRRSTGGADVSDCDWIYCF